MAKVVRVERKKRLSKLIEDKVKSTQLYKYFSFNNVKQGSGSFGNNSIGRYMVLLVVAPVLAIVIGILYKLRIQYCVLCAIAFEAFIPKIMTTNLMQAYKKKKFSDANMYIERMIFSFKRNGKILSSLIDASDVQDGAMKRTVYKAIAYMVEGDYIEDMNTEALSIIEDEYKCTRIKTLHKFLKDVEKSGGEFKESINILLDDARAWLLRTEMFQHKIAREKRYIVITEMISVVMGLSLVYTLPADETSQITGSIIYQLMTVLIIISFILFYAMVQNKLSVSWLDLDTEDMEVYERQIDKDYKVCIEHSIDPDKVRRMTIKSTLISSVSLLAVPYLWNSDNVIYIPFVFIFIGIFYIAPKKIVIGAKSRLQKEVIVQAPIWIRELILQLQTENVYNAIVKSSSECPYVLRKEVVKLAYAINDNPADIKSYTQFFTFLDDKEMYEIQRLLLSLYSITESGSDSDHSLLNSMINENNRLTDIAENDAYEDKVTGAHALVFMPMAMACIKLVIDALLLLQSSMQSFNGLG